MARSKIKVNIVVLLICSVVISACNAKDGGKAQEEKSSNKVYKLNVDIDNERKHQAAADKGYQPWKRNATEVAEECLINTGVGARSGECKVLSDDGANAVVFVNTKDGNFKVTLKKLVKPDGIWTATEIEKE